MSGSACTCHSSFDALDVIAFQRVPNGSQHHTRRLDRWTDASADPTPPRGLQPASRSPARNVDCPRRLSVRALPVKLLLPELNDLDAPDDLATSVSIRWSPSRPSDSNASSDDTHAIRLRRLRSRPPARRHTRSVQLAPRPGPRSRYALPHPPSLRQDRDWRVQRFWGKTFESQCSILEGDVVTLLLRRFSAPALCPRVIATGTKSCPEFSSVLSALKPVRVQTGPDRAGGARPRAADHVV